MSRRFRLTPTAFVVAAALVIALTARRSAAQEAAAEPTFKEDATATEYDPVKKKKERGEEMRHISGVLRDGPLQGNERRIDIWYNQVIFAEWTQAKNRRDLARWRQDFRNRELRQITVSQDAVHTHLNDVTLKKMIALAAGDYHPVVRHNAMLLIGDLNQKEAVAGAGGVQTAPEPLPLALTEKGALLDSVENAQQHPVVRVAAIVGVLRHAENSQKMPAPQKEEVRAAMIRVLKEKTPAENMSADGQVWLRTRAADVVGALALLGPDNESCKELAKVIDEADASLALRCAAARALGRMKLDGVADLKIAEIAGALGNLTLEVCAAELARAEAANETPSARALGHRTFCIQTALKGEDEKVAGGMMKLKAEGNDKVVLDGVAKTVSEIAGTFTDEAAQAEIKPKVEELEKLLAQHKLLRAKPAAATAEKPAAAEPTLPEKPATDVKTDAKPEAKAAAPAAPKSP
ncbi:MAG: hypothetical protein WD176_00105 [Pirellulales bacterium]